MPQLPSLEARIASALQALGLQTPPATPPVDPSVQDATATQAQSQLPGWKQTAIKAENAGVDFLRGLVGLGDQGPAGPTATNAGQMVGALFPLLKDAPGGMSKTEFATWLRSRPYFLEELPQGEAPLGDKVAEVLKSVAHPTPLPQLLEKHAELGSQPQQVNNIAKIVHDLTMRNPEAMGTTYNILNGELANSKSPLYAVAAFPEKSVDHPNEPKPEQIADFITKNLDLLKDPTNSIGTWFDKGDNKFTLDVAKTIPDRASALALGRQFKQKAIFDLQNMEEIPVLHTPEDVANAYAERKGFNPPIAHEPVKVNKDFATSVAKAYDQLKHDPSNPTVKSAYEALINEVGDQFAHITKEGGLQVEPWTKKGQPYANSKEMTADVRNNNHLYYFPTESGFGSGESADHPLLRTGQSGLPANDELRIVHDYLAHALGGHSFGPNGEENAFLEHAKLLSPEARKALATETRGQNSWVNFGPHSQLPVSERPFAPQKAGLLPDYMQEPYPLKQRTPPSIKGGTPSDKRMEELLGQFQGKQTAQDEAATVAARPDRAGIMTIKHLKEIADPREPLTHIAKRESPLVEQVKQALLTGEQVEPIKVRQDPKTGKYWLTDGHHRLVASEELGLTSVPIIVEGATK